MAVITGVKNCNQGIVGTEYSGCAIEILELRKAILLHPSVKIDKTSGVVTDAFIATLVKKGHLVVLGRPTTITEAGAKNNIETKANKSKKTISAGLIEFNIEYEANLCFIKALHKIKLKQWTLCLVDAEGKFLFDSKNNQIQGFEIDNFNVENQSFNDGGSKASNVMVNIQLTTNGTTGFNERIDFVGADIYDFSEVNGIQDVLLKNTNLSVANLVVKVVSGCDKSNPVLGLATANFRVMDATTNLPETVTVVELGSGEYKLSGATVGPRTIQLYDISGSSDVADILESEFFRSNIESVVLTA